MSDAQLLQEVKDYIGIMTDDEDANRNIRMKINTVKQYLENGGAKVKDPSSTVVGCIAVGVNDLLNEKAGETKFSPAFHMLAMQACRG